MKKLLRLVMAASALPLTAAAADMLLPGETLSNGRLIASPNGAYTLIMQTDGSLVSYRTLDGSVRYSFAKYGTYAIMQGDGNFVEYRDSTPIWSSGTYGNCSDCWVQIFDDGNIIVGRGWRPGHPYAVYVGWQAGRDPAYTGGTTGGTTSSGMQALTPPGPAPLTIPQPPYSSTLP